MMFHAAMDLAKPGDVIVIDAGGFEDRAIFGELMASYCKKAGNKRHCMLMERFATERALRQWKIFRGYMPGQRRPNGPYKNGPGEINVVPKYRIGGKAVVYPRRYRGGETSDGVLFRCALGRQPLS
ncbi:MAG: hypothetical protein ACLTLQ_03435 [[Clostridium] scindens]